MKLPPFGKSLQAKARSHLDNEVFVAVGPDAWALANSKISLGRRAVVLPDGHPEQYRWTVQRLDIVIVGSIHLGLQRRLALCLVRAGATVIRAIHDDGDVSVYRGKEYSDAA